MPAWMWASQGITLLICGASALYTYETYEGPQGLSVWESTSEFIPNQSISYGEIKIGYAMRAEFDFRFLGRTDDASSNRYENFFRVGFSGALGNGCGGTSSHYPSLWLTPDVNMLWVAVSSGSDCFHAVTLTETGIISVNVSYHIVIAFNDSQCTVDVSETNSSQSWRTQWTREPTMTELVGQYVPVWWMSNKFGASQYNRGGGIFTNVRIESYAFTTAPTLEPTLQPTIEPTTEPSADPTPDPTDDPTAEPSTNPTTDPIPDPTACPTADPTPVPTGVPTRNPTAEPTLKPTAVETLKPTAEPTAEPTTMTTLGPTSVATFPPISRPSLKPSSEPTMRPTATTTTTVSTNQSLTESTETAHSHSVTKLESDDASKTTNLITDVLGPLFVFITVSCMLLMLCVHLRSKPHQTELELESVLKGNDNNDEYKEEVEMEPIPMQSEPLEPLEQDDDDVSPNLSVVTSTPQDAFPAESPSVAPYQRQRQASLNMEALRFVFSSDDIKIDDMTLTNVQANSFRHNACFVGEVIERQDEEARVLSLKLEALFSECCFFVGLVPSHLDEHTVSTEVCSFKKSYAFCGNGKVYVDNREAKTVDHCAQGDVLRFVFDARNCSFCLRINQGDEVLLFDDVMPNRYKYAISLCYAGDACAIHEHNLGIGKISWKRQGKKHRRAATTILEEAGNKAEDVLSMC